MFVNVSLFWADSQKMKTYKITLRERKRVPACTHFHTSPLERFLSSWLFSISPSSTLWSHRWFCAWFCDLAFFSWGHKLPFFWLRAWAMVSGWLWLDSWAFQAAAKGDLKAALVWAMCRLCVRSLARLQMCLSALLHWPQRAPGHVTHPFWWELWDGGFDQQLSNSKWWS